MTLGRVRFEVRGEEALGAVLDFLREAPVPLVLGILVKFNLEFFAVAPTAAAIAHILVLACILVARIRAEKFLEGDNRQWVSAAYAATPLVSSVFFYSIGNIAGWWLGALAHEWLFG